ncbi:hypothetical protein [Verminephrobacter eiseniae]|nr:hypothetical protein [Verminephrobacter eiseniae]
MSNQRVASVRDAIEDTPEEAENMSCVPEKSYAQPVGCSIAS